MKGKQVPPKKEDETGRHNPFAVFSSRTVIGVLGGLIGLGGAEFLLPPLIGIFGFGALEAEMLNKGMGLFLAASVVQKRSRTGSLLFMVE